MTDDSFLMELAEELYSKRADARVVRYEARQAADFEAYPHECHGNVDRWVASHPGSGCVRGWLIYDYALSAFPMVRFQAHSVLEENGRLVDITPVEVRERHPFLRHPDGNEMFDLLVSRRGLVSVTHRLPGRRKRGR